MDDIFEPFLGETKRTIKRFCPPPPSHLSSPCSPPSVLVGKEVATGSGSTIYSIFSRVISFELFSPKQPTFTLRAHHLSSWCGDCGAKKQLTDLRISASNLCLFSKLLRLGFDPIGSYVAKLEQPRDQDGVIPSDSHTSPSTSSTRSSSSAIHPDTQYPPAQPIKSLPSTLRPPPLLTRYFR